MKLCKCGGELPTQRARRCLACKAETKRRWNEENKQRYKEYFQERYRLNSDMLKVRRNRLKESMSPADYSRIVRDKNLRIKFGIGVDEFDRMFAEQGNCCAICRGQEHQSRNWHVDHCHASGAIRQILCGHCNGMLGFASDSVAVLRAAISYLETHSQREVAECAC